jgi:hypothetical protein
MEARVDKHALHLAAVAVDGPKRNTPCRLLLHVGEEQASLRGRIHAWESSKLLLERRGVEVLVDELQVLDMALAMPGDERTHQIAYGVQLGVGARLDDIHHADSPRRPLRLVSEG